MAVFHGARNEPVLHRPAYFRFTDVEVRDAGGELEDTPADPPWPADYNHAHHDILHGQQSVAIAMAGLHAEDPNRLVRGEELQILREMAKLLALDHVDEKFKKYAARRFRRLFSDGGAERALWLEVAKAAPCLVDDNETAKRIRKLYQSKETREEWVSLMGALEIPSEQRLRFR